MKHLTIIILAFTTFAYAEGLTFDERARTASFVWKCQVALGGVGVFDTEEKSGVDRLDYLKIWAGEDIHKMGKSPEGEILQAKMKEYLSALEVLRSEKDFKLPEGWKAFETAEELAMILTKKLEDIAKAANLSLYLLEEYKDNNSRQ